MLQPSSNLFAAVAIAWSPVNLTPETLSPPEFVRAPHVVSGNSIPVGRSTADRFDELRSMRAGWGGPGTEMIASAAINRAQTAASLVADLAPFEPKPAVVPCADGSVQLEWHQRDSRFEIYFETDGSTGAWWHDRITDQEIEAEGAEALSILTRWAVRDEVWAATGIAA